MSANPYEGSSGSSPAGQGRRHPGMAQQQQQQQQQREPSAGPSSAGGDATSERSGSFSMGLGFLKGLASDRKTKEGQPQKRRGPKPDSKPALTRRQELNRQAQRTHRERKEFYIKSLEHEVMQLKEVYTGTVQEKNAVEQENERLRDLLRFHGITYDGSNPLQSGADLGGFAPQSGMTAAAPSTASHGLISARSFGSPQQYMASAADSPEFFGASDLNDPHTFTSPSQLQSSQQLLHKPHAPPQQPAPPHAGSGNLDYDQLGVDFVLASVHPEAQANVHGGGQGFPGFDPESQHDYHGGHR